MTAPQERPVAVTGVCRRENHALCYQARWCECSCHARADMLVDPPTEPVGAGPAPMPVEMAPGRQERPVAGDGQRCCCTCGRAPDRTLNDRGKFTVELRPYGPGGADICFECATATPEAERKTEAAFGTLLSANEAVSPVGVAMIGEDTGPAPFDPEALSGGET